MGFVVGDVIDSQDMVVRDYTTDGSGITKGDIVVISSGTVTIATASLDGPYGVALETYTSGQTARIIIEGSVYIKSSGTLTIGEYVSTTSGGDGIAYSKEAISTTPTKTDVENVQNKLLRIVGKVLATKTTGLATPIKLGYQ